MMTSSPTTIDEMESIPSSLNAKGVRRELAKHLTNVKNMGSFALFEQMPNPPNPGIEMKNGGLIGLPLTDRDSQIIVAASHAAPFGKGEHTIVDESVRKTWEVSPADFSITNPAWEDFLQSIVKRASKGLGVDSDGLGVSAELYKMLLYEEGAMFKPHQDSEKAPRMFGTLVIALPSKHDGGDVRVTHAGKTKIFKTSKYSAFDTSYLAWFADVIHEVRPVHSGRRWVLTYNLIHTTSNPKELSAASNTGLVKVSSALKTWKTSLESTSSKLPSAMAFLFKHQYTDANLSFHDLKGHDRQVGSLLREACEETGFGFYLANLKRTVEGGCEEDGYYCDSKDFHPIIDECSRETTLQKVFHLDGIELASDLNFDEKNFIQEDPFESVDPDDEDYSGFTGNEGVSATHFYNRTVAVIMPKNRRMDFLFDPSMAAQQYSSYEYLLIPGSTKKKPKILEVIERLSESNKRNLSNSDEVDDLDQLCQMVTRRMHQWKNSPPPTRSYEPVREAPFSNEVVASIAKASLQLGNRDGFLNIFETNPKAIDPTDIGIAIQRYDLESWLPSLVLHILSLTHFADRIDFLRRIKSGLDKEAGACDKNAKLYQKWLGVQTSDAVDSTAMTSTRDGVILANVSVQLPLDAMFSKVMPKVKQSAEESGTQMVVGFLAQMMDNLADGKVIIENVTRILCETMPTLKSSFSLCAAEYPLPPKRPAASFRSSYNYVKPEPIPSSPYCAGISTAKLLCHCQSFGYEAEATEITNHIIKAARIIDVRFFEVPYLNILKTIISIHQTKAVSLINNSFSQLFIDLLTIYLVRFIDTEPTPPKDWAMPKVNCSCKDCALLNAFLVDPTRKAGHFPMSNKRRQHLQSQIASSRVDCKHETLRQGNPQSLVVHKLKNQHQARKKAWTERKNTARKHMRQMGEAPLKSLLGDQYDVIMGLDMAKLQAASLATSRLSSSSPSPAMLASSGSAGNRVLPPLSKRKIPGGEVIVIDDD